MNGTMQAKVRERWGDVPDWIQVLAELVDAHGLKGAEKRIGSGASTISQVLSNTYRGVLGNIEARVRGALMGMTVDCPVKGEMGRDVCLKWQAKPFAATSSDRARMYHACRSGCPHSKHTKGEDHA
jgi:hypothetical protein